MRISSGLALWAMVAATSAAACGASDATKDSTSLAGSVNADQQTNTSAPASRGTDQSQPRTGCLTRGAEPDLYILQPSDTRASGSAGTSAGYRVTAARIEDLAAHVNQRVSIEGTVDAAGQMSDRAGTDARQNAAPGATGTAGVGASSSAQMPLLRATNISRIGGECTSGAGTAGSR